MSIWGIIIGGTAGFAMGGPIGALLGAAAGHAVEKRLTPQPDSDATKQVAFTVAVIALSAKMAKADGMVTRDEIGARIGWVGSSASTSLYLGKYYTCRRRSLLGS